MSTKDKNKAKSSDKSAATQFVVGIDLGTTNSALAYATPSESGPRRLTGFALRRSTARQFR